MCLSPWIRWWWNELLHAPPEQLRFFNGYCGWAPGQLAFELERGGWYVVHADADTVFRKNTGTLWDEMLVRGVPSARPCAGPPMWVPRATAVLSPPARAERDQLSGVSSDTPRRARRVSQRFGR